MKVVSTKKKVPIVLYPCYLFQLKNDGRKLNGIAKHEVASTLTSMVDQHIQCSPLRYERERETISTSEEIELTNGLTEEHLNSTDNDGSNSLIFFS